MNFSKEMKKKNNNNKNSFTRYTLKNCMSLVNLKVFLKLSFSFNKFTEMHNVIFMLRKKK